MATEVTLEAALAHRLTEDEFEFACRHLGRDLTWPELGVLSVMWSEHCSYKSSRVHLKRLPSQGRRVVQGPGENAGAVDIGHGWVAVFKMESHNHPSFIEPYQGAATGVGGILRDIFTMGARPVANLCSLRFGRPEHPRTAHLLQGVVAGIGDYGNCVGVPTVGGELYFDGCYDGNILVNVFSVGVARKDDLMRGVARGVGNPVYYVGAGTGRDGIHGATMASAQFEENATRRRPTVQVGDPFREKLLLEACLELMQTGAIVGIQDMGAAGLTSASVEMADRGGTGILLDIDLVPQRERGMTAYEVLLSESQERMLLVIAQGREAEVGRVFDRWELSWAKVGTVTDSGRFEVWHGGHQVCDLPVRLLGAEAPVYDRPQARPASQDGPIVPLWPVIDDIAGTLLRLMASPNVCSRRRIFEQFDHMVGLGTLVGPGQADAAVLRVPGTDLAMAVVVDCNARFVRLDPFVGAMHAVAEVTRNLSCVGATPAGITDCLNFGDPTHPEVMWQLAQAIDGIAAACVALDTPVVSGNVSLYNASSGADIYPTPTVAALGVFERPLTAERLVRTGFRSAGDTVILLGDSRLDDVGGSEAQWLMTGSISGSAPHLDLAAEARVQACVRDLIEHQRIRSAHDLAEGGLGVALAECLAGTTLGLVLNLPVGPADRVMFSESPSRVVVSCQEPAVVEAVATRHGVTVTRLGVLDDRGVLVGPGWEVKVDDLTAAHEGGLAGIF